MRETVQKLKASPWYEGALINVLYGAGGDASFAPQANLVFFLILTLGTTLLSCPMLAYLHPPPPASLIKNNSC